MGEGRQEKGKGNCGGGGMTQTKKEPEGPSIGFPFNVPGEFLDAEDEEEEEDRVNAKKILRSLRHMEVGA